MLLVQYYFSCPPLSPSLPPSLPVYTRPKVQAHHLLIRQKECNEIINVLELIMNMIKKAKISGASLSLPIHSLLGIAFIQGRRGEKAFQQSPLQLSSSPRVPVPLSLLARPVDQPSNKPATGPPGRLARAQACYCEVVRRS